MHAEVDNFKLSVDKITNVELIFRGYSRGSENEEWVEIMSNEKKEIEIDKKWMKPNWISSIISQ